MELAFNTLEGRATSCAALTEDNRIKLWNILTGDLKQQYQEENQARKVYTCIALCPSAKVGMAAVGTSSGAIVVWQLDTGEIRCILGGTASKSEGHSQRVNQLVFNKKGTLLYSCSNDKKIIEWNPITGENIRSFRGGKQPVVSIALSPDDSCLLAASSIIKMWDIASSKVVKKYAGHLSPVRCLKYSSDGSYFASSAQDRVINLWEVEGTDSGKKQRAAVATFSMDSNIKTLDFCKKLKAGKSKGKHGSTYEVCGVSADGNSALWHWDASAPTALQKAKPNYRITALDQESSKKTKGKKKSKEPKITNGTSTIVDSLKNGGVAAVRLLGDGTLLVVRYSTIRPVFAELKYLESSGDFVEDVVLEPLSSAHFVDSNTSEESSKKRKATDVTVAKAGTSSRRRPRSQLDNGESAAKKLKISSGDTKTIAERILEATERSQARKAERVHGVAPQAGSLQTILSQALHTNDATLMEFCLRKGTSDSHIIKQTVERLPTQDILPLLRDVIIRFERNPSRGVFLVKWVKEILKTHSSYLMSVPDLPSSLSGLYHTVNTRLSVFKKLLKLSGRLELLLSQVNRRAGANGNSVAPGPVNTFVEEEEAAGEGDGDGFDEFSDDDSEEEEDEEEEEEEDSEEDEEEGDSEKEAGTAAVSMEEDDEEGSEEDSEEDSDE